MRLIDADELIERTWRWAVNSREAVQQMIKGCPTIDAVQVVRCKDCKWWKTNYSWSTGEFKVCVREAYEPLREAEYFCSMGERRDEDE